MLHNNIKKLKTQTKYVFEILGPTKFVLSVFRYRHGTILAKTDFPYMPYDGSHNYGHIRLHNP